MYAQAYDVYVIGVKGTGRSSWLKKFVNVSDLPSEFNISLNTNRGDIVVSIHDVEYGGGYQNADAMIITYDVTRPDTLARAIALEREYRRKSVILGLKADLIGWEYPGPADILLDSIHNSHCGDAVFEDIAGILISEEVVLMGKTFLSTSNRKINLLVSVLDRFTSLLRDHMNGKDRSENDLKSLLEDFTKTIQSLS